MFTCCCCCCCRCVVVVVVVVEAQNKVEFDVKATYMFHQKANSMKKYFLVIEK